MPPDLCRTVTCRLGLACAAGPGWRWSHGITFARRELCNHAARWELLVRPPWHIESHSRGDRHHPPVIGFDQLPSTFMHQPVMAVAEKDQVGQLGVPSVDPVDEVMSVAP